MLHYATFQKIKFTAQNLLIIMAKNQFIFPFVFFFHKSQSNMWHTFALSLGMNFHCLYFYLHFIMQFFENNDNDAQSDNPKNFL